ncbi:MULTISPECIES: nSTAND1 domain-containing NTPase [Streptomyces]|uniref:nSTAND1 domain-containing NTPase n=1 Tax=Streptomyces TaxID=1883 RepID=UPI0022490848|nr:AAA family ATPase [Streptomyces sp. JHD 1]MCX2969551.1 hypothetical protein [Streptomyces sp. JHD 1]
MPRGERPLDEGSSPLLEFAAELRRLRRGAGTPSYRELARRAHYSIATLSEAAGGRKLPTLAVTLAYVRACGGDAQSWERRWYEVTRATLPPVPEPARGPTGACAAGAPPYAGLAAFDSADADRFFGRERLVDELAERLGRQRLVALVGASGEGKSSLLRAGLVPRLRAAEGGTLVRVLTPGAHPLAECLRHLTALGDEDASAASGGGPGGTEEPGRSERGPGDPVVSRTGAGRPATVQPEAGEPGAARSGAGGARARVPGPRVPESGRPGAGAPRAGGGAGPPEPPAPPAPPGTDWAERVDRALRAHPGAGELVLIIDQFEEVFTVCRGEREREAFLAELAAVARGAAGRCRVVLGVRADFYAHGTAHPLLVDVLREAQVVLGPMSAEELRQAIVEPARRSGLNVEGALQATLVAGAHGRAGVLPLLSHALLETWRGRRGTTLTLTAFQRAGGLDGGLAQTAEGLYTALRERQRDIIRQVFVRLVALGDGPEDTRRPLPRTELDDDEDTAQVLESAARLRLISLDHERVQLTHEALIRAWPRLRGWLEEDRDRLRVHRRLTEAAHAWEDVDRDPGALYRGERLALARELLTGPRPGLTAGERAFLDASSAAEAAARRSARRRTLTWRYVVALLAVLLAVAVVATERAARAQYELARQRDRAAAQSLADTAADLGHDQPGLAVQLGLTAYRLDASPRTRDSLLSTLATPWVAHPGEVLWLAYAPGGDLLATAGSDHTARLWRTEDESLPVASATVPGHRKTVRSVAFSPDGATLATASDDHTTRLWNITNPHHPTPTATLTGHRDAVRSVAFSPDGTTLATASDDHTTRLWNITNPHHPTPTATLTGHTTSVFSVAFSPDGATLATAGGSDAPVALWDVRDPGAPDRLATLPGHRDVVGAVAFSADGNRLATASDDRTVGLWDVSDPGRPTPTATLSGHTSAASSVAFSPDGGTLASSGFDRVVRLQELDFARAIARACAHAHPTISREQWEAHVSYLDYAPPCDPAGGRTRTPRGRRADGGSPPAR